MSKSRIMAALALSLVASAAWAHPKLLLASPAPGAAVAAPSQIRIAFSEPVFPRFSGVVLKDRQGHTAPTGPAGLDPSDAKVLVVPIKTALSPGAYHVTWHAVAADTHRVQGDYDFVVK